VNDICICIYALLQKYLRVLYVDLDVHHGDGVERAFAANPRVMTFSMHEYGQGFFPSTGSVDDTGTGEGEGFAVNVPLPARVGDQVYRILFQATFASLMEAFDPEAIVVQCGADAICGDLIGRLCVTTHAHKQCVEDILATQKPTILLGGGGYHVFHTAKCWAVHTAAAVGLTHLPQHIPPSDPYFEEYLEETYPSKPTLHVNLDPIADIPLSTEEVLPSLSKVFSKIHQSMMRVNSVRWRYTRALNDQQRDDFPKEAKRKESLSRSTKGRGGDLRKRLRSPEN
jgi:histone deacetylase 1/2